MKVKHLAAWCLRFRWINTLFEATLGWVVDSCRITRHNDLRDAERRSSPHEQFLHSRLSDLTVKTGPFEGLKYPEASAVGSALVPKLIGCYEKELHGVIQEICSKRYNTIVDVGCAEGYYAVGLGIRIPDATIIAFDTNPDAARLCRAMGNVNGISERLLVGSYCGPATFTRLPLGHKSLIFCDCEGYEAELFHEGLVPFLKQHDLLIELHDFVDRGISRKLRELFSSTHHIQSVYSVADTTKAETYDYDILDGLDAQSRHTLLAEGRPETMEWFYLTSSESNSTDGADPV